MRLCRVIVTPIGVSGGRAQRPYPLCVSVLHTRNMENLPNSLPDSYCGFFIVNIIRENLHNIIIIEFAEENINRVIV